jgi:hypothetical protein
VVHPHRGRTVTEIIAKHEDRHLLQAERIRADANFPAR